MANSTRQLRGIAYVLGLALCLSTQSQAMAPAAPAQAPDQNGQTNNEQLSNKDLNKAKENYKIYKWAEALRDYFVPVVTNTAIYSVEAYQKGGTPAVLNGVLKPTGIDVIKDGAKWTGKKSIIKILKDGMSLSPHKGQKKVVGWGVDGLIKGLEHRYKDNSSNWFSRFIMQKWLPSFVQKQVVGFVYKAAVTATGIDYPGFIKKFDSVHYLARMLIPTYAMMALNFAYGFGFDYLANR